MSVLYFEPQDRKFNIGSVLVSTDNTKLLILDRNGKNHIIINTRGKLPQNISGQEFQSFVTNITKAMLVSVEPITLTKESYNVMLRKLEGSEVYYSTPIGYTTPRKRLLYMKTKYGLIGTEGLKFKKRRTIGKVEEYVYDLAIVGSDKQLTVVVRKGDGDSFIQSMLDNLKHLVIHGANGIKFVDFDNLMRISGADMNNIYYKVPNFS